MAKDSSRQIFLYSFERYWPLLTCSIDILVYVTLGVVIAYAVVVVYQTEFFDSHPCVLPLEPSEVFAFCLPSQSELCIG